jgi:hypothetical protein
VVQPKIVILFWYWNDIYEDDLEWVYRRLAQTGPKPMALGPFKEIGPVTFQVQNWLRHSAFLMKTWDIGKVWRAEPPSSGVIEQGIERWGLYCEQFLRLSAEKGFKPLVIVLPDPNEIRGEYWTRQIALEGIAVAKQRGVAVYDCLEPIREEYRRSGRAPILPHDGHYNATGNSIIAEASVRALEAEGLLVEELPQE